MNNRIIVPAAVAIVLTVSAAFSFSRGAETAPAGITVSSAWARATPPGASVGAVYTTVQNAGEAADRIIGARSDAASSVMVHETVEENGVATMRHAEPEIAAGATLEMKPGGLHIMLMGLAAPLVEGQTVGLTLTFEQAGDVPVEAAIGAIGASSPPH